MIISAPPAQPAGLQQYQHTRIASLIHALARTDAGYAPPPALADEVLDYRRNAADLTALAGELTGRVEVRSALASSDFAAAMSDGLTAMLRDTWTPALAPLQSLARPAPVRDFRPTALATVELPDLVEASEDDAPPSFKRLSMRTVEGAQLRAYETSLRVSQQVFQTLGAALMDAVAGLSRALYVLELELASAALLSVPLDVSNSTSAAVTDTTLSTGWDAIASQGMSPAGVFVGSGIALPVRQTLTQCGLSLPVISSPFLPAGAAYVIADPAGRAALLRMHEADTLPGAPVPSVGWARIPKSAAYGYYCRHCVAYVAGDSRGLFAIGV